jgi:hypothetical protein
MPTSEETADFSAMTDSALLERRAEMRQQLALLSPQSPEHLRLTFLYDVSTEEVNERARAAWSRQKQEDQ